MKTRDQIITAALRKCGALGDTETATSGMISAGAAALVALIKARITDGLQIWKLEKVIEPFSSFTDTTPVTVGVGQTIVTTNSPLKLLGAWRRETATEITTPMDVISRQEYFRVPNPAAEGAPLQVYYQPLKTTGVLNIWPLPDATWQADGELVLDFHVKFTEVTTGTDVLDMPDHWEQAIIYELAVRLAPEYGVPINERQMLKLEADEYKKEALDFSQEEGSIYFAPDRHW